MFDDKPLSSLVVLMGLLHKIYIYFRHNKKTNVWSQNSIDKCYKNK